MLFAQIFIKFLDQNISSSFMFYLLFMLYWVDMSFE